MSSLPSPPDLENRPTCNASTIIRLAQEPPCLTTVPLPDSPLVAQPRLSPAVFFMLGLMLAAMGLSLFVKGELASFLSGSWEVTLLAVMCVLAYAGTNRPVVRLLSWLLLGVILAGGVIGNLIFAFVATAGDPDQHPFQSISPGTYPLLGWLFIWSALAAASALLAHLRGFRRLCSAVIGHEEWSSVHVLALASVISFTLICCVPLLSMGNPPFLLLIEHSKNPAGFIDPSRGTAGLLRDDMYSLCWTLLAATLAVGYGVKRNWSETLDRLGLKRISIKQAGSAVLLIGILLGVCQLTDMGISQIWKYFGWPTTNETALDVLFSPFISPLGAIVIGITAGVGEEVAVRGVLQPRLGILLSNLFFTSLHAYQYHWDALISVFLTGLMLGLIRKKTNTTVSAIVHGGFDFVLVMIAWSSSAMAK